MEEKLKFGVQMGDILEHKRKLILVQLQIFISLPIYKTLVSASNDGIIQFWKKVDKGMHLSKTIKHLIPHGDAAVLGNHD